MKRAQGGVGDGGGVESRRRSMKRALGGEVTGGFEG